MRPGGVGENKKNEIKAKDKGGSLQGTVFIFGVWKKELYDKMKL